MFRFCDGDKLRADGARPRDPDELPTLFDPALLAMSPQAFSLTGFERIDGVDYAQSWLATPAD
jgi:hypothetical protein